MTTEKALERLVALAELAVKPMLSAKECSEYTGYSMGQIRALCNAKRIPYYKNEGKVFFDRKEIHAWLHRGRVATDEEINQRANQYLTSKKLSL